MATNASQNKNPRIENLRRGMAELELRVTSLEKQVEYEGLNLSLDMASQQIQHLASKAVDNCRIRENLWTEIEDLIQTLNEQHDKLKEVRQISQANQERYDQIIQQKLEAEAREQAAMQDIRCVIVKQRKSG